MTRGDGVMSEDDVARAINAASFAAANEVYDYAASFNRREEYRPLEELARRVQRRALEAGVNAVHRAEEEPKR